MTDFALDADGANRGWTCWALAETASEQMSGDSAKNEFGSGACLRRLM
jgi:hypothetical protein